VEGVGCRSVPGMARSADGLLGSPVGGRHAGHAQKGEQVRALPGHEPVHRGLRRRHLSGQRGRSQAAGVAALLQHHRMLK